MEDKHLPILHNNYCGCWWPGDRRCVTRPSTDHWPGSYGILVPKEFDFCKQIIAVGHLVMAFEVLVENARWDTLVDDSWSFFQVCPCELCHGLCPGGLFMVITMETNGQWGCLSRDGQYSTQHNPEITQHAFVNVRIWIWYQVKNGLFYLCWFRLCEQDLH